MPTEADLQAKIGELQEALAKANATILDLTDYKQVVEEHLAHLSYLENLEQIDRAIQRSTDLERVLKDIIAATLDVFGCDRAWLLYPCDPDAPTWRVHVESTKPEYPGAYALNKDFPMTPDIAANFRELRDLEDPFTDLLDPNEPRWNTEDRFEVLSVMATLLCPRIGKPWKFELHQCSYPREWAKEEQALFKEIGYKTTAALNNLLFFQSVRESEEQFRILMEESPISIQIMSPDGRTIKVNRAWEELWGISLEDLSDYNILQDEQLKSLGTIPYIEKGFSGEAASIPAVKYEVQQTIETAKHTRWVEAHIYPAKDDDGNIRAVILMHENITERKQAEEDRERLHQQIVEAQQQTLRELSTPIIPLIEGIIVMPLIGSISTMRAKEIMRMVMAGISKHQAKVVIIDITGIDIVDSGVARHLTKTIQAARLKGAQTIITGVSDGVAEAIVDLGIDWSEIKTLRNLQAGLVAALASQGFKLSR